MTDTDTSAEAAFADWFRKNYPGPDTIIHDPDWHAPKIYRAATHALTTARDALTDTNTNAEAVDRVATEASKSMAIWLSANANDEGNDLWENLNDAVQAWGRKNSDAQRDLTAELVTLRAENERLLNQAVALQMANGDVIIERDEYLKALRELALHPAITVAEHCGESPWLSALLKKIALKPTGDK